jgi:HK97 gp10 family phage protein
MGSIYGTLDKLMKQLEQVGYSFTTDDLALGADMILAEAQALCPIDTGYLQSTGYIKIEPDVVIIGFDADYASYVEYGTYKMHAQPFLRPAIDRVSEDALNAIADSIESHMGKDLGGVQTGGNPSGNLQP